MSLAAQADDRPIVSAPQSVTALFDDRASAEKALADLIRAGVPQADVSIAGPTQADLDAAGARPEVHGFWEMLKDWFMPDEDRHAYAEALRRGGFSVAVRTDAAAYPAVIDILDRDGAVDLDEREAGWRREGWNPWSGLDQGAAAELGHRAPDAATAGFAASEADQWPAEVPGGSDSMLGRHSAAELAQATPGVAAPPVPNPGPVQDLIADPDISRRQNDRARDGFGEAPEMAMPRAATLPNVELQGSSLGLRPRRDVGTGRSRVRGYVADSDPARPDGDAD
jgi:hypothetical protein